MAEEQTQHNEQQPPEAPETGSSDSWLDELTPQARDYIKELRSENAARRVAAKDLEKRLEAIESEKRQREESELAEQNKFKELYEKQKADFEKLQSDMQAAQLNALRMQVGLKHGLPEKLIGRLQGSTEEELTADAQELAALIPTSPAQQDSDGEGDKPTPPARSQRTSAVPDGQPTKETDAQKRQKLGITRDFTPPSIFSDVTIIEHD